MSNIHKFASILLSAVIFMSITMPLAPKLLAADLIEENKPAGILGDADMDGKITVKDAMLLQKYLAKIKPLSKDTLLLCDIEKKGTDKINIKCATLIQKYVAKIKSSKSFGIGEPVYKDTSPLPTASITPPPSIPLTENPSPLESQPASVQDGQDLMANIFPDENIKGMNPVDKFINATQNFSVELLKQSIASKYDENINTLISPVSVFLALGMTSNGADAKTKEQFEALLGEADIPVEDLNNYYYTFANSIKNNKSVRLNIANSIWFDQNFNILPEFLQTNANYYRSGVYKADFSSKDTLDRINKWVSDNTDGLINKMLDSIDPKAFSCLINTVLFEAEWENNYTEYNIFDGKFTLENGQAVDAGYMSSKEDTYLQDFNSRGFLKPYKGERFSFAAILPNEGIKIADFLKSFDGTQLNNLLNNKLKCDVNTNMPRFSFSYENELSLALNKMGLTDAFNSSVSNFSKMSSSNFYLSSVLHKSYIQVDMEGTKAAAATAVNAAGTAKSDEIVTLNRPFVFAVIDNETNLPIFIGTVLNPALH